MTKTSLDMELELEEISMIVKFLTFLTTEKKTQHQLPLRNQTTKLTRRAMIQEILDFKIKN